MAPKAMKRPAAAVDPELLKNMETTEKDAQRRLSQFSGFSTPPRKSPKKAIDPNDAAYKEKDQHATPFKKKIS